MGTNTYITRAELWADNEGAWISADEWLSLVEEDPELHISSDQAWTDGYVADWTGPNAPDGAWFVWREGNIMTKGADGDDEIIGKMLEIAQKLKANVTDEVGFLY